MEEDRPRGASGVQIEPWKHVGNEAEAVNVRLCLCKGDGMRCGRRSLFGDRPLCLVLERHRVAGRVAERVR